MIFFLKCKGIFSPNCGYASLRKKQAAFLFYVPLHLPTPDEGTISSQMTSSNEGPAENASKVDQADPATQPFERRDDSTFFCVCCQMMVIF